MLNKSISVGAPVEHIEGNGFLNFYSSAVKYTLMVSSVTPSTLQAYRKNTHSEKYIYFTVFYKGHH